MLNTDLTPLDKIVSDLAAKTDPESKALLGWTQTASGTTRATTMNVGLSSIGNIMAMASAINKALGKIGLKVNEIKSMVEKSKDSPGAFSTTLHESIEKLKESKIKEGKDLKELVNAAEFLYKNMFRLHNKDILDQLEKMPTSGGDYETNVAKSIKEAEQTHNALLSQFNHQLNTYFGDLNKAFVGIYPYIQRFENKTDAREKRKDFIDSVNSLDDFKQRTIYMPISGYSRDTTSITTRERILNQLRYILLTLDSYAEADSEAGLKQVASNISSVLKSIIDYMDTHFKLFNNNFAVKQGVLGAAEDDWTEGGAPNPYVILTNVFDFENVKNLLRAYYRLGSFRYNLSLMAKENESYSEDNARILGTTVGKLKEDVRDKKTKLIKVIDAIAITATFTTDVRKATHDWYDKVYTLKDSFYSVMEQIELILGNFINAISKNPDSIKELRTLVDSLVTTSNWFDVQLGNDLCILYELFPHLNAAGNDKVNPIADLVKDIKTEHYYKGINDKIITPGNANDFPAYPFTTFGITAANWKSFTDQVKVVTNELNMVTNILSIFRKIGERFGNESTLRDLSMSMTAISNNLKEFVVVSTFIGYFITDQDNTIYTISGPNINGAANTGTLADLTAPNEASTGVMFDSVHAVGGTTLTSTLQAQVSFETERKYFSMIMKSMVTKIFTTLNVFDVFERPLKPNNALSAMRVVLGGANGYPVIYPEITNLYFRLLLLCETYQFDIFDMNPAVGSTITFVPDIDGIFAKLINLLFIKLAYVTNGDYTESDAMQYIEEVNNIYTFYKTRNSNAGSQIILEDFIVEINRRYGIIKADELTRIKNLRNAQYNLAPLDDTTMINGRLLEDAEDDVIPRKLAPSTMYYGRVTNTDFKVEVPSYTEMDNNITIFTKFRERIDDFISNMPADKYTSFDKVITQTQKDIIATSTDEEKFKILYRLLTFSDKFSRVSDTKLIMFHEVIIVPISLLNVLSETIDLFRNGIHDTDTTVLTDELFATQITKLLDFTTTLDSLVDIRMGQDAFVDFSGLKNLVQTMLNTVKLNINRFLRSSANKTVQ